MNKFPKIIVLLFFIARLSASVTTTAAVTGSRVVTGYLNSTNSITITMEFTGDHTAYNGGYARVFTAYAPALSTPTTYLPYSQTYNFVSIVGGFAGGADLIVLTAAKIQADMVARGVSPVHGSNMDIRVHWVKPDNISNPDSALIDSWGNAGGTAYLTFDAGNPSLGSRTGSFFSAGDYFNDLSITFTPSEGLNATTYDGTALQSYLKITGHAASPVDAAGVHYYYLVGDGLTIGAYGPVNILSALVDGANIASPLVDRGKSIITYRIYDASGN